MNPVAPHEREPVLDVLRGFAVLGILLINIEVMRGTEWLVLIGGAAPPPVERFETAVRFAIGWLATGKFVSSLAILFGVGAGLIANRALDRGRSPRPVLAKRYAWLVVFGIAHMLLLFPGDILFVYGLAGFALLLFAKLSVRTLMASGLVLLTLFAFLGLRYATNLHAIDASDERGALAAANLEVAIQEQQADAIAAFTAGSYPDVVATHIWQAPLLQAGQLLALPWILALFLFGYAVGRLGVVRSLAAHRPALRRAAWVGLALGLPANIGLGFLGPLAGFGPPADTEPMWLTRWAVFALTIGQPLLAVGYLSAIALASLSRRAIRPLAAVGRMALTAYLLQSALGLAVFAGLNFYDQLSTTSALLVVAGIWSVLLIVCPLWLRWFRMGPAEWLWRSLSYGAIQPLRNPRPASCV